MMVNGAMWVPPLESEPPPRYDAWRWGIRMAYEAAPSVGGFYKVGRGHVNDFLGECACTPTNTGDRRRSAAQKPL